MKRSAMAILSLTIGAALPLDARAADPVAAPAVIPPAAATAPSWTGIYGGGTVGRTHYSVDVVEDTGTTVTDVGRFGDHSYDLGLFAGIQAQVWRFVLGVEGDATWMDNDYDIQLDEPDGTYPIIQTDWSYSVSGRLGYLITPDTLLYARAGWAWIDVDSPEFQGFAPGSETIEAFQYGVGMEARFNRYMTWRTEVLYTEAQDTYDVGVDDFAQFDLSHLTARVGLAVQLGLGEVETAPRPETFDWSGFYIGVHGGVSGLDTPFGFYDSFDEGPYSDISGNYGARAGANVAIENRWVAGLEVEATRIGAEHSFFPDSAIDLTSAEFDWMGAVGVRFGWLARPDTLIYAKAGRAWIKAEALEPFFTEDEDALLEAFQYGAGIETKLTDRISVRLEGLFTDPDDKLYIDQGGVVDSEFVEPSIVSGNIGISIGF